MATSQRKILVTSALPYANGPIHLGHMLEYIQTDIWSRYQKLRGHECHYICADDAHGTPIMLKAQQAGREGRALEIESTFTPPVFAEPGAQEATHRMHDRSREH